MIIHGRTTKFVAPRIVLTTHLGTRGDLTPESIDAYLIMRNTLVHGDWVARELQGILRDLLLPDQP